MANSTKCHPVFCGGRVVGKVTGDVFEKRIKSNHILQKPAAISYDISVISQAISLGATTLRVITDSGNVYISSIEQFNKYCFSVERGYGEQLALGMERWSCIAHGQSMCIPANCHKKGVQSIQLPLF